MEESNRLIRHRAEEVFKAGFRLSMQGDKQKALDQYKHALTLYNRTDDLKGKANCLNKIGVIYCNQGNQREGLKYLQEELEILEKLGEDYNTAVAMINIAGAFEELKLYDNASQYYRKAQITAERLEPTLGKDMILKSIQDGLKRIDTR